MAFFTEDFKTKQISQHVANQCLPVTITRIFTARKRSLGQGNIFTRVCHSVHGGGRCVVAGGCMVAGGMHGCWGGHV